MISFCSLASAGALRLRRAALLAVLLAPLGLASAADFSIRAVKLPSGATITGTVSTDGKVGQLSPSNLVAWRVKVRQVEQFAFNPGTASPVSASGVQVSPDGSAITVDTSPNGVDDGGTLAFGTFGPLREYGVKVADFTGPYARGGQALYLAGAAWNTVGLREPNASQRVVGTRSAVGSAVYQLVPVRFASGERMVGTLTTDGSVGPLAASQIVDWDIRVVITSTQTYFRDAAGSNSVVLPSTNAISTDGSTLFVARPGGYLGFGIPPSSGNLGAGAVLADFTDTAVPRGQAGYYDPFTFEFAGLHFRGSAYPINGPKP